MMIENSIYLKDSTHGRQQNQDSQNIGTVRYLVREGKITC